MSLEHQVLHDTVIEPSLEKLTLDGLLWVQSPLWVGGAVGVHGKIPCPRAPRFLPIP